MRQRCNVSGLTSPDVDVVGALAWAQLQARRNGDELCLCHCPPELADVLDLCGLADALPACGSSVEVVGQPEERKQPRGVEEEADP